MNKADIKELAENKNFIPSQRYQILTTIQHLDGLRRGVEKVFPDARDFVRPGFDEIKADA